MGIFTYAFNQPSPYGIGGDISGQCPMILVTEHCMVMKSWLPDWPTQCQANLLFHAADNTG